MESDTVIGFNWKNPGKAVTIILSLMMISVLGFLDYVTGYNISFSIFYLLPITYAAFFSGISGGFFISVVSAGTWLAADLISQHSYAHFMIPIWNTVMRLGYFFLHTILLSKLLSLYRVTKSHSNIDPLTKAFNWRFFEQVIKREREKSIRNCKPFTLAYFDFDDFKGLNDTLGHSAGDDLLISASLIINKEISTRDVLARLGGDEFALLLTEKDYEEAGNVVKKIIGEIMKHVREKKWPATISMGVITFYDASPDINQMIKMADDIMYNVKNSGKNRIEHRKYPGEKTIQRTINEARNS